VVLALLFAKAWMREMGYHPNDKARMEEMKKTAGPAYGGSSLPAWFPLSPWL